ncbi:MAG: HD domain-containing protein, partial [Eggerthellaceae bacterium]|nr:HD domain-containing protein [Eggerthellaceae bacterium]
ALAYHPSKGLLDAFGGLDDLRLGTIRTVGNPSKRFEEDSLRILRACRFSSQLGFSIERETMQAALEHKHLLSLLPAERVRHELEELLKGNWVHDALMDTVDILTMVLPELTAMKGFAQRTPYHIYDVLEHTAWAVQHSPATPLARWAALFHDMGKPASFFLSEDSVGHFYGHARISVMLAKGIMGRLRFSSARQNDILSLVKHHDDVIEPSSKAVKRALSRLGGNPELFEALCDLKRADALSQAPHCAPRADAAIELKNILAKILEADDAFSLKNLAIDGRDVLGLGVKPGPLVGHLLNEALEAVIDERVSNAREDLLDFVSKRLASPF